MSKILKVSKAQKPKPVMIHGLDTEVWRTARAKALRLGLPMGVVVEKALRLWLMSERAA